MNLTLYTTSDDKRVVNKTLTSIKTVDCSVYNSCDLYVPSFLLEFDADVYTANYMYSPTFQRYYFIKDVVLDAGSRMIVSGEIDVLFTYASSIYNLTATVVRNENAVTNNLIDPIATFTPQKEVKVLQFPSTPFNARNINGNNDANYVLVVGGGFGS